MTTAAHCCWGKFEPFFFFFCESEKERQQEGSVARIQYITSSSSTSHRCSIWLRFGQFGGQVGTSASLLCSSNHEPFLLCETTHYPADGGKNPPSGLLPMDTTSWCHLKKKKKMGLRSPGQPFLLLWGQVQMLTAVLCWNLRLQTWIIMEPESD